MDDAATAEALIKGIRTGRRVDDDERDADDNERINRDDMEGLLDVVSHEIYNDPAHFILELVQNADDNIYPRKVIPKLTFVLRKLAEGGYLFVCCNEKGFTEEHVRAICRVRHSSKPKATGECTGEKGIGFKSVFSVASTVWIKSRALEFRFERDAPLGTIAPIWCPGEFPSGCLVDDTTMLALYIPERDDFQKVGVAMELLDYEIILFLRKISNIEIRTVNDKGKELPTKSISRDTRKEARYRKVWIKERVQDADAGTSSFIVTDRIARPMPTVSSRQSRSQSGLSIAFPVDSDDQAIAEERKAFCFLPIDRSFGLPFIIQADFITSPNRGDIVKKNKWNAKLLSEARNLFLESIDTFNKSGILKNTWPRYLQLQKQPADSIFVSFKQDLLKQLSRRSVLESRDNAERLQPPANAMVLPTEFTERDQAGTPLLPARNKDEEYISVIYNVQDLKYLKLSQMNHDTFLDMFMDFVEKHEAEYHERALAWHSMVASVLVDALRLLSSRTRGSRREKLKKLPIFLLRSKQWASASHRGSPLYIPKTANGIELPAGIIANILDDTFARDKNLHRLYQSLDARQLDSSEIQRMLLTHHLPSNRSKLSDPQILISHARFLFQHFPSYLSSSGTPITLYMATTNNNIARSNELYIDLTHGRNRLRKLFEGCRHIAFVSDEYMDTSFLGGNDSAEWFEWLKNVLDVNTLPRIFASGHKLTTAFKWLVENITTAKWLEFIRRNWNDYEDHLLQDSLSVQCLRQVEVVTKDGSSVPLGDAYIPTEACYRPQHAQRYVTYVEMEIAEKTVDPGWAKMGAVLNTEPDAEFYIQILRGMGDDRSVQWTPADVGNVFGLMHECLRSSRPGRDSEADITMLKDTFENEQLILILSDDRDEWLKLSDCRWSSYHCLDPWHAALEEVYADQQDFLCDVLDLADGDVNDVIGALLSMEGQEQHMSYIKALFSAPSKDEWTSADASLLSPDSWESMAIFPVKQQNECLEDISEKNWFIPDRTRYKMLFDGKIQMLDLDLRTINSMMPLITALRLEHRLLSRVVKETHQILGDPDLEPMHTKEMQNKAEYISLLVDNTAQKQVITHVRSLEIWSVPSARTEPVVGKVHGQHDSVPLWLDVASNRIYVKRKTLRHGLPVALLAQSLADFLGIPSGGNSALLLTTILTTKLSKDIEDVMENAGYITDSLHSTVLYEGLDYSDSEPELDDSESVAATPGPRTPSSVAARKSDRIRITRSESPTIKSEDDPFTSPLAKKPAPPIFIDLKRIEQAANDWDVSDLELLIGPDTSKSLPDMDVSADGVAAEVYRTIFNDEDEELDLSNGVLGDSRTREIGFGGELFVFRLFQRLFSLQKTEWTSKLRTKAGQDPFGSEKDFADFTLETNRSKNEIPEWLRDCGYSDARRWTGKGHTYHIEVKTTLSESNEPPTLSANQMRLARQWHESLQASGPQHVFMLVRIFDLLGTPKMCIYVDPFGLMREGALLFAASRIVPLK